MYVDRLFAGVENGTGGAQYLPHGAKGSTVVCLGFKVSCLELTMPWSIRVQILQRLFEMT